MTSHKNRAEHAITTAAAAAATACSCFFLSRAVYGTYDTCMHEPDSIVVWTESTALRTLNKNYQHSVHSYPLPPLPPQRHSYRTPPPTPPIPIPAISTRPFPPMAFSRLPPCPLCLQCELPPQFCGFRDTLAGFGVCRNLEGLGLPQLKGMCLLLRGRGVVFLHLFTGVALRTVVPKRRPDDRIASPELCQKTVYLDRKRSVTLGLVYTDFLYFVFCTVNWQNITCVPFLVILSSRTQVFNVDPSSRCRATSPRFGTPTRTHDVSSDRQTRRTSETTLEYPASIV